MRITDIIWLQKIVDKIEKKQHITQDEVEQSFVNNPQYRFISLVKNSHKAKLSALSHQLTAFQPTLNKDISAYITIIYIKYNRFIDFRICI